jgi:hypothetical protein
MKVVNQVLAVLGLMSASSYAAAPAPGQAFYLKVVGGNALTSGAVLRDNNTYDLGVTAPLYYDNPPYAGDHPSPISISTDNLSELIISPTNPHPGPISGRLALVSNGPADWTLSKAFPQSEGRWNVGPDRDNATVKVYEWKFKDAPWGNGATVLRWSDTKCSGRWIAAKKNVTPFEGPPYVRWVIHWLEGNTTLRSSTRILMLTLDSVFPGVFTDFESYLGIDLEISSTP